MKKLPLILLWLTVAAGAATPAASPPLRQNGGTWPTSHVQGIAVDLAGGYIYYSFTTLLAKYDFSGRLVGTLTGWTGHLGDLDFNPRDGRVYGSLEYKQNQAFYIAVIDVGRLNQVGVDAAASDVFRTVYLPEVVKDYTADLNGDGVFDGDVAATPDHRYGCSGIDGVSFGPEFGRTDGPRLLTVAYGIYTNLARTDNDHQVLLQYDIADWARYEHPLTETAPHRDGPTAVHGKYFVRTGNTNYGVQNLAYDEAQQRWFLGVYKGAKPSFPNYLLFAVEARTQPVLGDLVGVPGPSGQGTDRGRLLALAADGLADAATGIRGWNQKADVGIQPIGHGLFYLCVNSAARSGQTADLTLHRWTGTPAAPFVPATTGDLALVTVAAPVVTCSPRSVAVIAGSTLALTAAATGNPPPNFQWSKDGTTLAGATADTLLLTNLTTAAAGNYTVVVTNSLGSATSGVAAVVVAAGQPSRLCNFSVRASLAANQTLIVGLVVDGAAAKTLLIRGVGAKLAEFGVGGALANPTLAIYDAAGVKIAENDSWNALLQPVARRVGAFDLTPGSRDAALLISLPPGSYTAQIAGAGGATGEALVEVYEVS